MTHHPMTTFTHGPYNFHFPHHSLSRAASLSDLHNSLPVDSHQGLHGWQSTPARFVPTPETESFGSPFTNSGGYENLETPLGITTEDIQQHDEILAMSGSGVVGTAGFVDDLPSQELPHQLPIATPISIPSPSPSSASSVFPSRIARIREDPSTAPW